MFIIIDVFVVVWDCDRKIWWLIIIKFVIFCVVEIIVEFECV